MEDLTDIQSIIHAVQDQHETIGLLQAEIHFQKDRIDKQEIIIKELTNKVDDLTLQIAEKKKHEQIYKDEDSTSNIWKGTANLSIAEAVKETAEKALMTNLGFVFDPNTRLYCNYSTGYYYDPGTLLFYNGHTGVYYTFDADNQEYIFHSQVTLEQPATNKTEIKNNKKIIIGKSSKSTKSNQATGLSSNSPHKMYDDEDWEPELIKIVGGSKKTTSKPKVKTKKIEKSKNKSATTTTDDHEDMEEGELSEGSSSSSSDDVEIIGEYYSTSDLENNSSHIEDSAHPPCIRVIILETCSPSIKKGSLFLVTCMGGSIGSEEHNSIITLPDSSVDKHHATIIYSLPGMVDDGDDDNNRSSKNLKKYLITDIGSSTGTFLNGVRLSEPLQSSEPHEIVHGSIVKIGGFSLLMHIHPGSFTCGHCEPGLLLESTENTISYQSEKPKSRNALMKQIKKKYGLVGRTTPAATTLASSPSSKMPDSHDGYKDRALERRLKKGSDNPYEKTQVVTAEESISVNNKGFKMLAKMGWEEGKSLGSATNNGILEPIKLELKNDRAGLGHVGLGMMNLDHPTLQPTSSVGHKKKTGKNSKTSPLTSKSNRADQLAITLKRFKEAGGGDVVKMDVDANLK